MATFTHFFDTGVDTGIAALWVSWCALVALRRILGARTLRTFALRLLMGGQRVIAAVVVAAVLLALWRGGIGFFGAPVFIGVAALLWWTLLTLEAWIDRRDRLVFVVRHYA